MRMNARSISAAAAALLFAASTVPLAGCGKPEAKTPPNRRVNRAVAVNVVVTYNPATGKGEIPAPSDKIIELSEKYKDYAQWVSPDGLVHVKFLKDSPFDANPVHERNVLKSHSPKKGTAGQGFDYTMELERFSNGIPSGTRVEVVDPRIEIVE